MRRVNWRLRLFLFVWLARFFLLAAMPAKAGHAGRGEGPPLP